MTDNGVETSVRPAISSDSLDHLIDAAFTRASTARGGNALVEQMWGSALDLQAVHAAFDGETRAGHVWIAQRGAEIVAGALVRDRCVQAIWVQPALRRHKIATALLSALMTSDDPPVDAWALPGDRATKSLYESVGWKARLLTMRGA
jgi:GNAT superfamily N-acetyltransferase